MNNNNKEFDFSFGSQVFRTVMGTLFLLLAIKMWIDPYFFYIDSDVRSRLAKMLAVLVYVVWSRPFSLIVFGISFVFYGSLVYAIYKRPAQNAVFGFMLLTTSFLSAYLVFGEFDGKKAMANKSVSEFSHASSEQTHQGYQTIDSYKAASLKSYSEQ